MSTSIFDDAAHWRERAEDARDIAEQLSDPIFWDMMLRMAESCERLAEHARVPGGWNVTSARSHRSVRQRTNQRTQISFAHRTHSSSCVFT